MLETGKAYKIVTKSRVVPTGEEIPGKTYLVEMLPPADMANTEVRVGENETDSLTRVEAEQLGERFIRVLNLEKQKAHFIARENIAEAEPLQ
ncbi:hypothetical protein [Alcanivorax sp.]|uniref:hypothetical protein n=1 Tax=Alcanivorax sp. TaxID=1872427 RepID=UPI0025910C69|nr:hypothetical protein [Alcanivorax sp.]